VTEQRGRGALTAGAARLGRTIVQAALKTALVIFDALNVAPGSTTSSIAHLPVVLPRRGDEPAVEPHKRPRFRRRRRRRTN